MLLLQDRGEILNRLYEDGIRAPPPSSHILPYEFYLLLRELEFGNPEAQRKRDGSVKGRNQRNDVLHELWIRARECGRQALSEFLIVLVGRKLLVVYLRN